MNFTKLYKLKGYLSGKIWNSKIDIIDKNITLEYNDLGNLMLYGVERDLLEYIISVLNHEKCIFHISGNGVEDKQICYEIIDYDKTLEIIDSEMNRLP